MTNVDLGKWQNSRTRSNSIAKRRQEVAILHKSVYMCWAYKRVSTPVSIKRGFWSSWEWGGTWIQQVYNIIVIFDSIRKKNPPKMGKSDKVTFGLLIDSFMAEQL